MAMATIRMSYPLTGLILCWHLAYGLILASLSIPVGVGRNLLLFWSELNLIHFSGIMRP